MPETIFKLEEAQPADSEQAANMLWFGWKQNHIFTSGTTISESISSIILDWTD